MKETDDMERKEKILQSAIELVEFMSKKGQDNVIERAARTYEIKKEDVLKAFVNEYAKDLIPK